MHQGQLTDTEKAERYAALFERLVTPFLTAYLEAKARRAGAPDVARAQRLYERAHGAFNTEVAYTELEDERRQLTGPDAPQGRKDMPTDG